MSKEKVKVRFETPGDVPVEELPVLELNDEAKTPAPTSTVPDEPVAPPRQSLEVETEVHDNLRPRIEAHLTRMRAWDMRKLEPSIEQQFRAALIGVDLAWVYLADAINALHKAGFVAKTTPVTRIAAKLEAGTRVSLREDKRAELLSLYSEEQLDSLEVQKVGPQHAVVIAGDGTSLGPVKLIHLVVKNA
jgi:hypothetical protein